MTIKFKVKKIESTFTFYFYLYICKFSLFVTFYEILYVFLLTQVKSCTMLFVFYRFTERRMPTVSIGASVAVDADTSLITWWRNLKIRINPVKVSPVGEVRRAIDGEIRLFTRPCP